jgi:hypothetical protein
LPSLRSFNTSEVAALDAALADFSKTDVLEFPTTIAAFRAGPI